MFTYDERVFISYIGFNKKNHYYMNKCQHKNIVLMGLTLDLTGFVWFCILLYIFFLRS